MAKFFENAKLEGTWYLIGLKVGLSDIHPLLTWLASVFKNFNNWKFTWWHTSLNSISRPWFVPTTVEVCRLQKYLLSNWLNFLYFSFFILVVFYLCFITNRGEIRHKNLLFRHQFPELFLLLRFIIILLTKIIRCDGSFLGSYPGPYLGSFRRA